MQHYRSLLAPDELRAFRVVCERGRSPFLLACDHAGSLVPRSLGTLGLATEDLQRHIACDLGAAALAVKLAVRLNACLILQIYSRLVIDCNRPPESAESIVSVSDHTYIVANESLSKRDVQLREREVFRPYHDRISAELDLRSAQHRRTALIAVHSFVPRLHGHERAWHAGVLYNRDGRLAKALLDILREQPGLRIGDNEPYSVNDQTDYTIPVHGEQRGLPHAGIEVRQDLIADEAGQDEWAERLAGALERSLEQQARWPLPAAGIHTC
jgi:predicted N-formylglutamate amidohydrolase